MKLLTIANTKQKWLEMSFSSAGFFACFFFFLWSVLRYYVLIMIMRYWQMAFNPFIADD